VREQINEAQRLRAPTAFSLGRTLAEHTLSLTVRPPPRPTHTPQSTEQKDKAG
jgi:hypothetical protein